MNRPIAEIEADLAAAEAAKDAAMKAAATAWEAAANARYMDGKAETAWLRVVALRAELAAAKEAQR